MRNITIAASFVLVILTIGCLRTRPKPPIPNGDYTKQMLADVTNKDLLQDYNAMPEVSDDDKAKKVARRNQILNELIWLIDRNYYSFENISYGTQAAYTTGLKTSIDKNFLDQQTRSAIVQKMRALRDKKLATIQDSTHMGAPAGNYSLEAGLADVYGYYDAGTVVGALQSIAESVAQDNKEAEATRKKTTDDLRQKLNLSKLNPEPAATPAGVTGTVQVVSNPDGAEVYSDGAAVGNAPSTLKLSPGKHTVRVTSSGYKEWSREITVQAGSEVKLNAVLEKE